MFQRYFGLARDPFSISPDPAFLYPSDQHRQALAHLKYGLQREGGFILLTGEVGTGKTTLTRLLLEQVPANFRLAYILNARLGVEDLLASICKELAVAMPDGGGHRQMVDQLYQNLLQAHTEGYKTLVVIEEAQNLDASVLETLRLLTNLETNTAKLLHILLVGQPELLETLRQPSLRQLDQRVVSRHHLQPLRAGDVRHYVSHRMKAAGASRPVFSADAIAALQRLSGGIPRKINLIAERSLMGSYASNLHRVGRKQVNRAAAEVFGQAVPRQRYLLRAALLPGLALVAGLLLWQTLPPDFDPQPLPAPSAAIERAAMHSPASDQNQQLPSAPPLADAASAELRVEASPLLSPYAQLLQLWSVEAQVESLADLCRVAAANQLRCVELSQQSREQVLAINRPFLALAPNPDRQLITSAEQLQQLGWPADLLYLWQPPVGYDSSLRPGDRNSTVVSWLLPKLESLSADAAYLITGGNYTDAVAALVAEFQRREALVVDGVLGQQTLMRINELENQPAVPLLSGAAN